MTYLQKDDMSTEMTTNSTKSSALVHVDKGTRISAKELHKYAIGLVGILILCIVTYPIAIYRVTQQEKFATSRSHLKSLTAEYKTIQH